MTLLMTGTAVLAMKANGPAAFNGLNHAGQAAQLYLYEKDPVTWEVIDSGAWGKMTYTEENFVFNGHGLEPKTEYTLIRYMDPAEEEPWSTHSVVCLGEDTSSRDGAAHIMGEMITGGQKVWLVLSDDVDCGTGKMIGWNPSEYLFEYNLITDASYITNHGNGIYSYTHLIKDGEAKQNQAKKASGTSGPACYKLMGHAWDYTPYYTINPTNSDGLTEEFIVGTIETSIQTWDASTSFPLFGSRLPTPKVISWGVNDGHNYYSFGDYPTDGVIAVCRTWYNTGTDYIVEYDIMFDEDFTWGDATVTSGVMDLQNIATHEIGHGMGLLDVYQRPCNYVTMYGYSTEGDTAKRTLETPDILAMQLNYGV